MKNTEIIKTFKVVSNDQQGNKREAIAPRGYVQASDYAKRELECGHNDVQIIIDYAKAK